MVGNRTMYRHVATRLTAALVGAAAVVSGTLVPLSFATATPAGASSSGAQASTSGIASELEYVVENLPYIVGSYIEGNTRCPVSEVGYIIVGEPGPPPCAPGQIGG